MCQVIYKYPVVNACSEKNDLIFTIEALSNTILLNELYISVIRETVF